MKTKSLMTMLLGGAMLAACTADDALNSAPVAQEVNPSAPVFKVTFEDDDLQNRGELDGQYNMVWGSGDLMSLFHGVSSTNLTNFSGWQNAIYEAEGGDEGQLTFLTNAMVQLGYAMMVYPADLGFEQTPSGTGTTYPVISLPDVQDAETKGNTPYISEILNLTEKGENGTGVAGYRQEYDIVMRRAATTMTVNLKALKPALQIEGVEDFEIKSVELIAGGKNKTPFTKSISIKPSQNKRTVNGEEQTYWAYNTEMEIKDRVDRIITTDVKDNSVVTFTLLKGTVADLEDCSMVLHTNYGDITVDETGDGQWVGSKNKNTTDALEYVYENTFAEAESGTFKGEEKGRAIALTVGVDLQDIKLNGMHIADENALNTALLVYEGISSTETPTLILDGQGDDHVFEITDAELRNKVVEYMNAEKQTVKFQACTKDENEKCLKVKLVSEASTKDASVEVPNLVFDKTSGLQTTQADVAVELAGFWKYNSSKKDNEKKVLTNVDELVVLDGGVLELQSADVNVATGGCDKIVVNKGGSVTVVRNTIVDMNLDNHGTINIAAAGVLSVADNKVITNWWSEKLATDADDMTLTGWNQTDDTEKGRCGVINVEGTLGAADLASGTTNAKINNYGVIVLKNTTAVALVSNNATPDASTANPFKAPENYTGGTPSGSGMNVFGEIILHKDNNLGGGVANALTQVVNEDNQGFIKFTLASDKDAIDDNVGPIANYVIVTGTKIGATADKTLTKDYLEVAGATAVFGSTVAKSQASFELKGLIIPQGRVEISKDKQVEVEESIYLKGNILGSGTLTRDNATFEGYFAGEEDDYRNIVITPAQ